MKYQQFFYAGFFMGAKEKAAVVFKRLGAKWYLKEYPGFQEKHLICRRHFPRALASMGAFCFFEKK